MGWLPKRCCCEEAPAVHAVLVAAALGVTTSMLDACSSAAVSCTRGMWGAAEVIMASGTVDAAARICDDDVAP